MYKFSRTIDGQHITPLADGVTQVQALPDFTVESKYVRITLQAGTQHSITLPANTVGFEIDTDLDDILLTVDDAGQSGIASKLTATTITESNFSPGMLAPSDRKSFTVGNNKTLYMRSAAGGDVNIYAF
tara:strand:- start:2895 stop:3281 length:387 start_codon:yes stop_codon:yes gene_type:complete